MRRTILIADDDPILREIAAEHLREAGFVVTLAEDGVEALKAVARMRFDLVVTDMMMPNMDGIELIQALTRDWPDTPVIGISAGTPGVEPELILRAAKALGAVSVLPKPLDPKLFLEQVNAALKRA